MKKTITSVIILVLIVMGLSGCTQPNDQNSNNGGSSKSDIKYYSNLIDIYRDSEGWITQVIIEVFNTGNISSIFIIDFEFTAVNEENLGPGTYSGGNTSTVNETAEIKTITKSVYVEAHSSEKVYCIPSFSGYLLSSVSYSVRPN